MAECQSSRVEGLARRRLLEQHGGLSARPGDPPASTTGIHWITYDWVAHVLQVDPNLVGSARVQLEPQKVDYLEACHHSRVGAGGTPVGRNGHALAVACMAGDRRFDPEFGGVQVSPSQSRIASLDPPSGDGGAKPAMSKIGLGHNHQSRRVSVEPVHDPRPSLGPARQRCPPGDQRIDEGIVPVSRCRMDDQAGGFVDDREVLVLEDEREWNGGGSDGAGRFVLGDLNSHHFPACQDSRGAGDFPLDRHQLVGHQPRRLSAGYSQLVSKEFVEPLARGGQDSELEVLPLPRLRISQPEPTPLPPFVRPLARGKSQGRSHRSSRRCQPR